MYLALLSSSIVLKESRIQEITQLLEVPQKETVTFFFNKKNSLLIKKINMLKFNNFVIVLCSI